MFSLQCLLNLLLSTRKVDKRKQICFILISAISLFNFIIIISIRISISSSSSSRISSTSTSFSSSSSSSTYVRTYVGLLKMETDGAYISY